MSNLTGVSLFTATLSHLVLLPFFLFVLYVVSLTSYLFLFLSTENEARKEYEGQGRGSLV